MPNPRANRAFASPAAARRRTRGVLLQTAHPLIPHALPSHPNPLGSWVAARRVQYKRGTLTPEQITTLQDLPGWVWDVKASRWEQGLRLLTAYAHHTGTPNPDSYYIETTEDTDGTFTLGAWAMSRRKEYRRGVLSPTRIAALQAITGWEWNPYDAA